MPRSAPLGVSSSCPFGYVRLQDHVRAAAAKSGAAACLPWGRKHTSLRRPGVKILGKSTTRRPSNHVGSSAFEGVRERFQLADSLHALSALRRPAPAAQKDGLRECSWRPASVLRGANPPNCPRLQVEAQLRKEQMVRPRHSQGSTAFVSLCAAMFGLRQHGGVSAPPPRVKRRCCPARAAHVLAPTLRRAHMLAAFASRTRCSSC